MGPPPRTDHVELARVDVDDRSGTPLPPRQSLVMAFGPQTDDPLRSIVTVCSSSLACGTAYNASGYTPPSSTTNPLAAGQISNQSMVCNTSPRVFTAGQMSCEVIVRSPPAPCLY